ncbi:MAG: hypothetical protein A2271_00525 [Candidatus Moranbacteria bacterium RIFOXYA12_FULL_35_19]|nr:MAG: hypothetical protein UR78_C0010G0059 [Candidatus Moranbacteria bacterium GW2011_GWF2_35_39]OGI32289.1 MAG: hypothetical protein A2489_03035 [Candidatus Moranbacteria bacterium RIFOXYC12_FULL_36_13]OGI35848.1 MAG: hypothetical protein A2271_00525 [Candidatus Moranbacteria bacterium RIFOXYA12_FULL_35_19]
MDDLVIVEKKSTKAKFLPLLLILPALILIFFSQYPKNFATFFGAEKEKEQEIILTEIQPVQEVQAESETPKEPEIKPEENNIVPEESSPEETAKEETPKEEVPRPDLTIGIIADAHAGQEKGFSHLNSAIWVLKNQVQPDIVIDLGDLIESRNKKDGFISKKSAEADYRKARSLISAYFPLYSVVGNHELLSMSKDNVNNITGQKNYYAITVKNGYRLIILDANYNDKEEHIDAKHDDAFIYTGNVSERQLGLLNNELKNNDKNIILIHHPLWNLENKNDVSRIIKKYKDKIVLVANGHKHPVTLGIISFGGVKNYNIPSAYHQRTIAVVKINGNSATVSTKKY